MPTVICPECDEDIYVDPDLEQGETVSCDECGSVLVIVGLDPLELDMKDEDDDDLSDDDSFDDY